MEIRTKYKPQHILITTDEAPPLALENLSAFLYDLVLIHDRLFLLLSTDYKGKVPSGLAFYRRKGRPIKKSERLQVSLITKKSPPLIEIIVPAILLGAPTFAWTFFKILEKVADWNEDRAIKRIDRQIKEIELHRLIREETEITLMQRHPDESEEIKNSLVKDVIRVDANEQLGIKRVEILPMPDDDREHPH
jgi:hypothetical protein